MRKRKKRRTLITVLVLLLLLVAVLALVWQSGYDALQKAAYPLKYEEPVYRYAEAYGLPPPLVFAVIRTESGFDPDAESSAGAKGLMQLVDGTYEWVQDRLMDDPQPSDKIFEPEVNIHSGCCLLQYLIGRFGNVETALAAYNAGSGNVAKWLKDARYSDDGVTLKEIPYAETKNYVERVTKAQKAYQELYNVDREES